MQKCFFDKWLALDLEDEKLPFETMRDTMFETLCISEAIVARLNDEEICYKGVIDHFPCLV